MPTMQQVAEHLRAVGPSSSESVGIAMWPHLRGRMPMGGGPSHCAIAATFLLKRMLKRGLVYQHHKTRCWHAHPAVAGNAP